MAWGSKFWLRFSFLIVLLMIAVTAEAGVLKVRFNDLELGIDQDTGSVMFLSSPATGLILEAVPESAGLIDLAYPLESFAAMRLASRFSKASVVQKGPGEVLIEWDKLGASRANLALPSGVVSAYVTIRAANDGKSVILACRVENKSSAPIPQELFPDLWGLKPFAGVERTRLRLAGGAVQPFVGPVVPVDSAPFYAMDLGWRHFPAGGSYAQNALRWLDYGGYAGGLSVFQKEWGTEDRPDLRTHRAERDPMSLRLLWEHKHNIAPGQTWQSGEFWLTPHRGGWAKGIEAYRNYVRQVSPPREIPRHVREGIGFQTIWMMQSVEVDPARAAFRFKDLPHVAEDAHQYGIDELVPWGWCTYSTMPIPLRPGLGSLDDFLGALRQAREQGVNIAPFVSIAIVLSKFAGRYGVKPGDSDWTYHYEMIPNFRPYYSKFWNGVDVDSKNEIWRQDALTALTEWIKLGLPSFTWDVFGNGQTGEEAGLVTLIEEVRKLARARDPQSTFGGESTTNLELDSSVLDYTWNWADYEDAAPITNVLRSPRLNCDVEDSPLVVKKAFADNLYLNVMPRKPDLPNGTALISEKPALGAALKEVARLRQQFLPYFVDGTFIADSVLTEPTHAFVRGYQRGKRLLIVVLNDQKQPEAISVESDLSLWLPSTKSYEVSYYDSTGKLLETSRAEGAQWFGVTRRLSPLEIAFFEIASG